MGGGGEETLLAPHARNESKDYFFLVLEIKPRDLHMLVKLSDTQPIRISHFRGENYYQ
jgi:hypothetical protein